jgi:hypothetical protein
MCSISLNSRMTLIVPGGGDGRRFSQSRSSRLQPTTVAQHPRLPLRSSLFGVSPIKADDELGCGRLARQLPDRKIALRCRDVFKKAHAYGFSDVVLDGGGGGRRFGGDTSPFKEVCQTTATQSSRRPRPDMQKTADPSFRASISNTFPFVAPRCTVRIRRFSHRKSPYRSRDPDNLRDRLVDVFERLSNLPGDASDVASLSAPSTISS